MKLLALSRDKRIKYLHNEKNSGAALTRNKALREARGEWIAFLDSDDLWMPEKLEHQIEFMKKMLIIYHTQSMKKSMRIQNH